MSPRLVAQTMAVGRIAIAATMIVAPDVVTRRWVGIAGEPTRVLARGFGARDVVLGLCILTSLERDGDEAQRWVAAAAVCDAVDAAASLRAGDRAPRSGRWGTAALAGGAALAGAWLTRAL